MLAIAPAGLLETLEMLEKLSRRALRHITASHEAQLDLCQVLERIADELPDEADPVLCRQAAASVYSLMEDGSRSYREELAPEMATNGGRHLVDFTTMIARLLRENREDLDHAEELQEVLGNLAKGERQTVSSEALGYMLRGFFEARRRRIALERELLAALNPPGRA